MKIIPIFALPLCFPVLAESNCEPDSTVPQESYKTSVMASNHHSVYTEIVINAKMEEVWRVLTDFEKLPQWSSTLQGINGHFTDGSSVTVLYKVRDQVANVPHEIQVTEGVQFGWSDELKGPAPGIFDNHYFRVEAISICQSRFIQTDAFKGNSVKYPDRTTAFFAEQVLPSYRKFNRELKLRVEALSL